MYATSATALNLNVCIRISIRICIEIGAVCLLPSTNSVGRPLNIRRLKDLSEVHANFAESSVSCDALKPCPRLQPVRALYRDRHAALARWPASDLQSGETGGFFLFGSLVHWFMLYASCFMLGAFIGLDWSNLAHLLSSTAHHS